MYRIGKVRSKKILVIWHVSDANELDKESQSREALMLKNVSAAIKWSSNFAQIVAVAGSISFARYHELEL